MTELVFVDTYLLTEDLQPGQDLDGLLVVNPFRSGISLLE
jgi:predicted nucleic acid-binding protein